MTVDGSAEPLDRSREDRAPTDQAAAASATQTSAQARALVSRSKAGWWGWFGSEVVAAVDLSRSRNLRALDDAARHRRVGGATAEWLSRCWSLGTSSAVDLRWVADGRGRVRLFLLGRTAGTSRDDLDANIEAGQRVLGSPPDHVVVEPLENLEAVSAALAPFTPCPGAAEVRKRCVVGTPSRPDAGVAYYFAIQPFGSNPTAWPPLIAHLAGSPVPLTLSIGLQPAGVDARLPQVLAGLASAYGRLSEPGEPVDPGLYRAARALEPEPFAVVARRLYQAAAHRLQGQVFRIRVSLLSPEPLAVGSQHQSTIDLVASALRHQTDQTGSGPMASEFATALPSVEIPTGGLAFERCVRNVEALGFEPWGGDPIWQRVDAPPPALREVTDLVDVDEALAAAQLPVAQGAQLAGFPVVDPRDRGDGSDLVSGLDPDEVVVVNRGGTLNMSDNSISITGSTVGNMQGGTGNVQGNQRIEQTVTESADLAAVIAELVAAVHALQGALPDDAAAEGADLAGVLDEEVRRPQPDRGRMSRWLGRLKIWADDVGEIAEPVLTTAAVVDRMLSS